MFGYTGLRLNTAPATEPVSVATLKDHARVDGDDEDTLLATYLQVARERVEQATGRALVLQTWDMFFDRFPAVIKIPKAPLSSVTHVKYTDTNGNEQTLSSSLYQVDTKSEPARIIPAYEEIWPVTRTIMNAVEVQFVAGYAGTADTSPDYSAIPQSILQAIMMIAADYERHRQDTVMPDVSATQYHQFPMGARALLNQHRVAWVC